MRKNISFTTVVLIGDECFCCMYLLYEYLWIVFLHNNNKVGVQQYWEMDLYPRN